MRLFYMLKYVCVNEFILLGKQVTVSASVTTGSVTIHFFV